MNRSDLLCKIQSYSFAAYDMLLYLDTHPNDKKAFNIFKDLVEKSNEYKKEFEENFGPLSAFSTSNQHHFNWLDSPWPWEKEANK